MAKKDKAPLTPEQVEIKAMKKKRRGERTTRFFAVLLAALLALGVVSFGKKEALKLAEESQGTAGTNTEAPADDDDDDVDFGTDGGDDAQAGDDATGDDAKGDDAQTGDKTTGGDTTAKKESKADMAKAINDATAKAAKAGYDWTRQAKYTQNVVVTTNKGKDATDILNGFIKGVAKDSDLNSVIGNFIGIGEKKAKLAKGSEQLKYDNGEDVWECKSYLLKGMALTEGDISHYEHKGNVYKVQLQSCENPQKNDGSALANATDDFLTQDEANAAIATGLGSDKIKIESSTVKFTKIVVVATITDGTLKDLTIDYDFSVNLTLNIFGIKGSGKAHTTIKYSNFVY